MPPAADPISLASDIASTNGVDQPGENGTHTNGHINGHSNGMNGFSNGTMGLHRSQNWIPLAEHVLWKPERKVKMISIGCGFSGLTMANKIMRTFKMDDRVEHILYEKNRDVGGTWFENKYPGVMCDVPAHIYTLLDLPNPEWPNFYATGAEIQDYLCKIKKKYNLDRDVQYNSKVTSCIWDEKEAQWHVEVEQDGQIKKDTCDILVNGSGVLNAWSWPEIQGLRDFKGHLSHSADYQTWEKGPCFDGKRVAVIGNGSSAIQIVPSLAKVASKLYNVVRTPTWISAPFVEDLSSAPGTNAPYSEEEKEVFRTDPKALYEHRHKIAHAFNHFYSALIEGSDTNKEAMRRTKQMMEERLEGYPELAGKLIPKWSLGCRRLTPGNGYLESLTKDHVDLVVGHIEKITETGIQMKDDTFLECDAIVCATGFDVSFKPRYTMQGRDGKNMAKIFEKDAQGYFSLCVSGFPNHFVFNGPAAPVGHGSLSSAIDWSANYILKWVDKVAREDIRTFDVKQEVQDDWNIYGDEILKRTVWASGCRSWYKNGTTDGRISALYPGSILHFKDMIENIRGEDFNITYRSKNQWKFLGDGFTQLEVDDGDLGYYLTC